MTNSCCSHGRCIHCRRDLRWFVAGLSALALVSLSDNVDADRGGSGQGLIAAKLGPHVADVADWISGRSTRSQR